VQHQQSSSAIAKEALSAWYTTLDEDEHHRLIEHGKPSFSKEKSSKPCNWRKNPTRMAFCDTRLE
jgi:hypothetical protein